MMRGLLIPVCLHLSSQVELFEKDIDYIRTELNHVSAADTSPISLYEYFHISPIKVRRESQKLLHLRGGRCTRRSKYRLQGSYMYGVIHTLY